MSVLGIAILSFLGLLIVGFMAYFVHLSSAVLLHPKAGKVSASSSQQCWPLT
jgi:hypothetical protein